MHTASTALLLAALVVGAGVATFPAVGGAATTAAAGTDRPGATGLHGWGITADAQVVGDGTVLVSEAALLEDGYLVAHVPDDGEPGRAVGHVRLDRQGEFHGVQIELDEEYWASVEGSTTLMIAAHESDGDREFTWPDGDPVFEPGGEPVVANVSVRKTDGPSGRVYALHQDSDGNVTVRRAELPRDGFVVLYAEEDGERGQVVGSTYLEAGRHENVSVPVDPHYYNDVRELELVIGVHADDGDGAFDPAEDEAVAAGDQPVTTHLRADKERRSIPTRTPTATPEPTATPAPTGTPTPSPTPAPTGTPAPTATPTPAAGGEVTATPPAPTQPGFGPAVAGVGLLLAGLLARRRFR